MYGKMKEHLSNTLAEIKEAGLYKEERLIESAQQAAHHRKREGSTEFLLPTITWVCPTIRD